jgi:hypothetical protein
MDGNYHYEQAEQILSSSTPQPGKITRAPYEMSRAEALSLAQVHATLALADATEKAGIGAARTSTSPYPDHASRGA